MTSRYRIVNVKDVTSQQIEEMYVLMTTYYDNLSFDKFIKDLEIKDKVILLVSNNRIYGFTSLEMLTLKIAGKEVIGIYSGNTIVDKNHQVSSHLQKGFISYVNTLMEDYPDHDYYWFLICKGYKTYKYMSMYFNEYYPNHKTKTPAFEQAIMDQYAKNKFGRSYDAYSGLVMNKGANDYLKETVAPVTERLRSNPVVDYFVKVNPNHARGDELICIAKFDKNNLKPCFYKMTKRD